MAVNHQATLRYNDFLNNTATKMLTGDNRQSETILQPITQIEQYKTHCYGKRVIISSEAVAPNAVIGGHEKARQMFPQIPLQHRLVHYT